MSRKLTVALATAGFAAVGAAALPGGGAAHAATVRCGAGCVTLASQQFGAKNVAAVSAGGAASLAPFWYSPSEDFAVEPIGTVQDLYRVGVISNSVARTYGSQEVYQYQYVPVGNTSIKCLGVAGATATAVTLQPCGVNANTLWIGVTWRESGDFLPLVNAAASTKSAMVLTATTASGPLTVTQMALTTTTANGVSTTTVAKTQMWALEIGVYGSATLSATPAD